MAGNAADLLIELWEISGFLNCNEGKKLQKFILENKNYSSFFLEKDNVLYT